MNRTALINRLAMKGHEDIRLKVYDDATGKELRSGDTLKGNATIGIGRNLTGRGLTYEEAFTLCSNDVVSVEHDLDALCAWWRNLDETRQQVLAEMCFNLGASKLMNFTRMLSALKANDFDTAAQEMLISAWANQTGQRAIGLADAMKKGAF